MHGIKHIEFKELTLEDLFEAEDQSEIEVEIEREREEGWEQFWYSDESLGLIGSWWGYFCHYISHMRVFSSFRFMRVLLWLMIMKREHFITLHKSTG